MQNPQSYPPQPNDTLLNRTLTSPSVQHHVLIGQRYHHEPGTASLILDYINLDFRGLGNTTLFWTKINQFIDRVETLILSDFERLTAEFARSKDPIPFEERLALSYLPVKEGDDWGQTWDSAWFHLQGQIPDRWAGHEAVAHLDFNSEALIFSPDGEPLQGLTNGSVFGNVTRHTFILSEQVQGGEGVDLWVEAAANSTFGINRPSDPPRGDVDRHGSYQGTVNKMRIALLHRELYALLLDMRLLNNLLDVTPDTSTRYARILKGLLDASNQFQDDPARASICRETLAPLLAKSAHASAPTLYTVGHAHIDTGWLWPVRETIRKSARTFSNQLELLSRYPDYVFGASQPQHYQFVKENYPGLFDRIKQAVAEGKWELQGGMWVEPDCNLISGESMVRQIIHGKNFFMDEFGVDVNNCWIPDVFGYSASMPQILKRAGIDYFLTQKISWNQVNRFPHTTFRWRGIDGSEILTHFPPEDTYNSQLDPVGLIKAEEQFVEKPILDEMICLFGVGDGGGGPTAEMIERGTRQQNLEGVPKVKFAKAGQLFERLAQYQDQLAVWSGELYLEYHRGTYTTQARTKRNNRMLECRLRETEYLLSLGELEDYPIEQLDRIWKTLLINQFHDILPGSSIRWVYEVTEKEHLEALEECARIQKDAAARILETGEDSLTIINTLNIPFAGELTIPKEFSTGLVDESGNTIAVQRDLDGKVIAQIKLEPQAIVTLRRRGESEAASAQESLILENKLIRYEFNNDGQLIDAFDKEEKKQILADDAYGNIFTLYEDRPHNFDAWEIDISYEDMAVDNSRGRAWQPTGNGCVRQGIQFELSIGQSSIIQKVYLNHHSKALEFDTCVNWQERHRMLRTEFAVNVRSDSATFDIQYGCVRRPTHRNTSWDVARFEVAAHKYADLSDNTYGVALLNDCKYGHKIHDNIIDLNLLRSPTSPDPDADIGSHQFRYVLYPHQHAFLNTDVIEQAQTLNQPPLFFPGQKANGLEPKIKVKNPDIGLEVLKRGEKEAGWIVRMVEKRGCECSTEVEMLSPESRLQETDLMEWHDYGELLDNTVPLMFKPFEIRTFKIR